MYTSLYSILDQNEIDIQAVIHIVTEGVRMERLNRDAQKLIGNHPEYLHCELRIAQGELFLHALRYGNQSF
jgi:hypothetical protein